ncbi:MAG: hypothetical protein OJJ54_04960 [Pseudonocardia sp.]|nr:hypothetical protein [Pseudonocardia sp.]
MSAPVLDQPVLDQPVLGQPVTVLADDTPRQRLVRTRLDGGMDAVLRVVTLLRGRAYEVRGMSVDLRRGTLEVTVLLDADGTALLLERLRRLPSVRTATA